MDDEPPFPDRPRLSPEVHARLHVVDGEPKVILHEWRTGTILEIDVPSFRALAEADGTRDLDSLCLALAKEGIYHGESDLVQLLTELHAAEVLVDGLSVPRAPPPVASPETPPERPLEVLADFELACDGSGSCCRFYGSVAFSRLDALKARLVAERLRLPILADEVFTPIAGAQMGDGMRAVAQVDGRCAFLESDARCGLHREAGPEAKPLACRFYPASLVDDGVAVRVSLAPECACVFASIGERGDPLVPRGARTYAEIDPEARTIHLPDPVPLDIARTASRAELRAWSAHLCAHLERHPIDAPALAWKLAELVASEGLAIEVLDRALADREPPEATEIAPWLRALSEHAIVAAQTHESWRSASDLSRRTARWIADALVDVKVEDLLAFDLRDEAAERFYLRALAHAHRLALEGRPLAHGLRDRAVRLLAARAMSMRHALPEDPAARYPLALLEAAIRNLGMAGYADPED
jgi:lysine-N-methylase